MIHSMGGGIIREYDRLIYVKVRLDGGNDARQPTWYRCPFPTVRAGDGVLVPYGARGKEVRGVVERVEKVTAQTAPYPVNRTREVIELLGRAQDDRPPTILE